MGSKSSNKYRVLDYHMSIHYGICYGPVDGLTRIFIKERDAWPGTTVYPDGEDDPDAPADTPNLIERAFAWIASLTTGDGESTSEDPVAVGPGALRINKPELFGGNKKEGGSVGWCYWLPGDTDQVLPDVLAAKLAAGKTGAQVPGFRGMASAFFYGDSSERGFMWTQNNPYLPPTWFQVFRRPRGLNSAYATIQVGNFPPDANPAHIIYECLTNATWGMGASSTLVNVSSFEAAGLTLFNEKFGLSLGWFQQASIESFISEILDHIQATLYIDPETGLLTLTLIRDDYDVETLQEFGPHNCVATNRQQKTWDGTINEINVVWTNPETEQEETVTFQDRGNIAVQGGVVSDTRNYYGIRNATLAAKVGARDIRSAAAPLYACDIECDRSAWRLKPGGVLKFSWPEDNIDQMVMRIGKIDYGRPGSGKIKVSLLEDIFALEQTEWIEPPRTQWTPTEQKPTDFPFKQAFTMPYPAVVRALGSSVVSDDEYPRVVLGIFAAHSLSDVISFETRSPAVKPNGDAYIAQLGTMYETPRALLQLPLVPEAETTITGGFGTILGGDGPVVGGFVYIGSTLDKFSEIAMLDDYDAGTDTWTLARGVLDTIPRAWPVGTPLWFVGSGFQAIDPSERVEGEVASYRLLPRTSLGLLPYALATDLTFTASGRPYFPFRPANVSIDGQEFVDLIEYATPPATIEVEWSNRNRLMEDTLVRRWGEGNVTPEAGQTTKLIFRDVSDVLLTEIDGLAGTSYSIDYATLASDLDGNSTVKVQVVSERDGYESLQGVEVTLRFDSGYGYGYGYDYGGA